jgi:hypothetical protein
VADYDYDELFPNRFIKAGLLKGRPVTLTIAGVEIESMPDKKGKNGEKKKGILSFRERELQLVLNKTNGECLRGMFGRKTGAWVGKRVTLYPKMVDAFGSQELAIRILGSPDLKEDLRIELNLGQKRSGAIMKKTGTKSAPAPAPEPEPELEEEALDVEHDAETGEVLANGGGR